MISVHVLLHLTSKVFDERYSDITNGWYYVIESSVNWIIDDLCLLLLKSTCTLYYGIVCIDKIFIFCTTVHVYQ